MSNKPLFEKILIANRGEIALRILRACREMGIKTVAVHSTADADSMHVRLADESVCIGPAPSRESYLNMAAILSAADITGADAIHPGVGFLSENATFARMVEEHGKVFIGPTPEHIEMMGDKITAKKTMIELKVPVVPGSEGAIKDEAHALATAEQIGFPVLIKATSGGGGKGMKVAYNKSEVSQAFKLARSEAKANFGNDEVYMERYLSRPRHIEVQVLADQYGNAINLGERDCSIQRRHQKIWEEAPSPALNNEIREKLGSIVNEAISKMGYRGVGTLEFLYENGEFFFMEMNTRIQVEHPITELVTGIDLVKEQIKVAAGQKLEITQQDIKITGHAIECRINAEHAESFIPSPGEVTRYHAPGGWGVRIDSHLYQGYRIPPHYDSLVAKLIVYGHDRSECINRVDRALKEYVIDGIDTIIPLHQRLAQEPDILSGDYDIHWLEKKLNS
ncbi:acetyl-CoA carboxylase biotin carboxylase subunit [Candidatus Odyssella thessalonicensis]|uniref:acetyl-CoA carboxylase biotin carboxylase subunit n=1 Tax=Candidatus Odyssella thessalonicensis TaxID=84647 RepID=UPI000225C160|nr:acetyl-CoA carboxylase biotin carboxylase subunit [Candidatus Odyssella thessalonicensis]